MKIYAIIITYNPNLMEFKQCLLSLINQVDSLLVIDNSDNLDKKLSLQSLLNYSNVRYYSMNGNIGIAEATNKGLSIAETEKADWVVISDQDSVFPSNYIETFKGELQSNIQNSSKIAAIAPIFYDRNTEQYGKFCYKENNSIFYKTPEENLSYLYQAIASGLLINIKLISAVGFMCSELFIDLVDHEWCWRANSKGYYILGCKHLVISHNLGDSSKKVGKNSLEIRNSIRLYYFERNYVYLAKYCGYLSKYEKNRLRKKAIKYLFVFPLVTRPHVKSFIYMIRGVFDGLNKKMGKINI